MYQLILNVAFLMYALEKAGAAQHNPKCPETEFQDLPSKMTGSDGTGKIAPETDIGTSQEEGKPQRQQWTCSI